MGYSDGCLDPTGAAGARRQLSLKTARLRRGVNEVGAEIEQWS